MLVAVNEFQSILIALNAAHKSLDRINCAFLEGMHFVFQFFRQWARNISKNYWTKNHPNLLKSSIILKIFIKSAIFHFYNWNKYNCNERIAHITILLLLRWWQQINKQLTVIVTVIGEFNYRWFACLYSM